MKKVGIMGGTFNPVHYGHLILAENAYEQFNLDHILFMPSKNPPHKLKSDLLSDEHRTNMVLLAIEDNPRFVISTIELDREGTTYTADTLTEMKRNSPDTEYYFIVGADSLFNIMNWKEPQTIFQLCTILAAGRDSTVEGLDKQIEFLTKTYQAKINYLKMPNIEISSKKIRELKREDKSIRYYVPEKVNNYINMNNLYGVLVEEQPHDVT